MVAPDGAVSFAEDTTFSVTRLKDGVFTPHDLGQLFATPFGVAVAPDGTVWATVQNTNKLVRIAPSGEMVQLDAPTRAGRPRRRRGGRARHGLGRRDAGQQARPVRRRPVHRVRRCGQGVRAAPPARPPFGIVADRAGNLWYTDLSGWLGMLPAKRARAR